jgi:hypothetical protein
MTATSAGNTGNVKSARPISIASIANMRAMNAVSGTMIARDNFTNVLKESTAKDKEAVPDKRQIAKPAWKCRFFARKATEYKGAGNHCFLCGSAPWRWAGRLRDRHRILATQPSGPEDRRVGTEAQTRKASGQIYAWPPLIRLA